MEIESGKLPVDDTIPLHVNLKSPREKRRIVSVIHEIYGSLNDEIEKYSIHIIFI